MKKVFVLFVMMFVMASICGASVRVKGYARKDGTYVQPHRRTEPDSNKNNNWSSKGNTNPYTGKRGTK